MPAITTSPTGSTPTPSPRCTGTTAAALLWSLSLLVADALAPVMGAAITLLVTIPQEILGLYLGFLAGILLYLATSDILPEAHARHPSRLTLACTVLGVGFMWLVIGLAS